MTIHEAQVGYVTKLAVFYLLTVKGAAHADNFTPGTLFVWALGIGIAGGISVTLDLKGTKYLSVSAQARALLETIIKSGIVAGIAFLFISTYNLDASMKLGICGVCGISAGTILDAVQRAAPNFLEAARVKLFSALGLKDSNTPNEDDDKP